MTVTRFIAYNLDNQAANVKVGEKHTTRANTFMQFSISLKSGTFGSPRILQK